MNIGVMSDRARSARPAARESEVVPERPVQFEHIFLEEYPRVLNILVRLLGDRDEAEDLALETFWRLHRRPPARDANPNPGGWLYRVATNLGLNALRARKRRARYELEAGSKQLEQSRVEDPQETYAAREEQARVRAVLAGMEARQAELLLLRYSGMSYQEAAEALGLSPNSIGTLLLRAEREFERRYREAEGK